MNRPIALLTDFGLADAYVGTMKGVMLSICPTAHLIDITHDIRPQQIRQAAYMLWTTYRYFPPDTIFMVVVDPGVGTSREPIAVATDHGIFVAPDNGVLSYVLNERTIRHSVRLQNPAYRLADVSQTFHGRDIFSPAAAHLANGVPVDELGPVQPELVRLDNLHLTIEIARETTQIRGEVLHIDQFGNVITSIGQLSWIDEHIVQLIPSFGQITEPLPNFPVQHSCVTISAHKICPIQRTYGRVAPGTLVALVGSSGQLEIGINQGHAAQTLGATSGDAVTLTITHNQD
ncbi:MAG: SAM-dependent chlorinase/fluorinase [Anaerolineae bacterium]|nr:SAM-dependent chlorinase/fluorinase [Anaerolineae bacterium]